MLVRALVAEVERRGIESVTLVNTAELTPEQLAQPAGRLGLSRRMLGIKLEREGRTLASLVE